MDMQTSVAERVQTSDEQSPSAFSWDALKNDPTARLSVLKKARETAGAGTLLPVLYDQLRLLAASKSPQQEEMKERLVDMLTAFGMELDAPLLESPVVESMPLTPTPPPIAPLEITPPADAQNQGFAGPRPTPQFSTPVPVSVAVPMPAPETMPKTESPPENTPEDAKQQFVADIKAQLSGASDAVVSMRADPYREPILESISPTVETVLANDDVLHESPKNMPPEEQNAPLMSTEVTKGLEQLLSEWDLFKSSGIFGLGAGGTEHPLYKTLAALPVMSVLSGRWEGADAKAVANIKEYMDGWKGQWSIEADPEESFETYLRRVIAEILHVTLQEAPQTVAA